MRFSSLPPTLLFALALQIGANAAPSDEKKPKIVEPCTVASSSGSFYDLSPLTAAAPPAGKKPGKNDRIGDWRARGYDYKSNFTLNICAPVVKVLDHATGIDKKHLQNISAYYEVGSKIYSIGWVTCAWNIALEIVADMCKTTIFESDSSGEKTRSSIYKRFTLWQG